MAKSLMEGMDAAPAPAAKKSGGGDTGKLVFAVALLLIAGLVVAWSQGWLFSSKPQNTETPEQRAAQEKAFEEQQKHTQEQLNKGTAKTGGTS